MQKDTIIEVWETGTAAARAFEIRIAVDGEVVMNRRLNPVEALEAREISSQYASFFSNGKKGKNSYLHLLGESIFRLFFQPGWQELGPKILSGGRRIVVSSIPQILLLPWELLRLPGFEDMAVGSSPDFAVLRVPMEGGRPSSSSLPAPFLSQPTELRRGPLRMLFFSTNLQHFEEEELSLLKAVQGLDIHLEMGETASFEELKSSIESFQPHLVYLSGEAKLSGEVSGGEARLAFMDPAGKLDLRSAEEIAPVLKSGGVECIILGGGGNGPDPARDLLCQRLAEDQLIAVAWNGTVTPQEIVRSLSLGASADEAIWRTGQRMLKEGLEEKEEKKGAIQAYPFIYAVREPTGLFDPNKKREEIKTRYQELPPLPGMTEGHARGFLDRRKDLLRLYPDLRQGAVNALIITGELGRGKSALANYLARMLAASGYFVLPLGGTAHNPISSARLIEAAGLQLTAAGEYQGLEETNRLLDSSLPVNERLVVLMELLRSNRILIFWDDLGLDEKTGRISDSYLGELFDQMTKGLHSSRAIISCPRVPANASILPRLARNWKLDQLSRAAFLRFMLQDRMIADGYRKGEIAFDALSDLYSLYERDPSKLEQIRSALMKGLPTDGDPLARLVECLSPESLLALQCIAVYDVAMSPAGFAAAAGTDLENIAELLPLWEELSICYKTGDLWAVHSSARPMLREGLSPEERREAHKRAGRFLEEMAESGRSPELFLFRLDGLLEARGHYLEAGDLAEARRVTARISSYLDRRGYYTELIRLNREILELEPDKDSMNWIAQAYAHQMDLENAAQWYKKALDMAPDAFSYQGLGMIRLDQGEHDQAEESLEKALQMHLDQKDLRGEAAVLQALASIDMMQGHYDSARPRLARSLELAREAKDRAGEAVLLFYLADVDRETGELARATEELIEALAITRDLGDRKGMAASLHGLGMISSQAGEMEMAAEHFREALQVYQELKDQPGEAGALFQLGALAVQMDRIQEGLRLMALSAVVLRSINSDEVKNIEPVVERLASQLNFSQDQFVAMLQEVMHSYVKDRGMGLVKKAWRK
ncbi:MAG: tetratricopeptide repeat protein [Methanothrix sp.]|jgi:tetratricopeptide (TPR) repeat protein|uniref:tetratricopeptide repeat protein n=1 Tax=Methanothrix sp. TaxID=90426 RepID=UPI0025D37AFA|nr:tetratricopeptide repeat protein [Methanothrix sp.]MCK9405277.1 tetratricopeptide repeat protein [Methanothrix sp.]